MKKKILALMICLISFLISNLKAQHITGDWYGVLEVMGTQVTLVFHFQQSDSGYSGILDSPDQGAMGMPFNAVEYNDNKLILREANIGAFYEGIPVADSISGTWNQGGQSFELNMYREKVEKRTYNRPQEPEKPYPYYEEVNCHLLVNMQSFSTRASGARDSTAAAVLARKGEEIYFS
ncbi:hypothetical protein [Rhodohalobacter sulfatireducens]|uniref:Lipocalin-like domain-containing protein n=1 Tax=Rhodohalobacter sulfatireducens TaxID=2911366 RepID=A0ABS9KGA5_9BACT|nr:hypothetical protein [Rhodohalobacter sulfatireducens]MCG2589878.1 hypothetical protein [Rhodohalobacter sulfatireducens]